MKDITQVFDSGIWHSILMGILIFLLYTTSNILKDLRNNDEELQKSILTNQISIIEMREEVKTLRSESKKMNDNQTLLTKILDKIIKK